MRWRRSHGFTMFEVLAVVSITAVLGALLVPGFFAVLQAERSKRARDETRVLAEGVRGFRDDTLGLPAALGQLVQDPGVAGWTGPYAGSGQRVDVDPFGNAYAYRRATDGSQVVVASAGPDGVLQSQGDLDGGAWLVESWVARGDDIARRAAFRDQDLERLQRTRFQVDTVARALVLHFERLGGYPASLGGLVTQGLISSAETVDPWRRPLIYAPAHPRPPAAVDAEEAALVYSRGPDGADDRGGDDDIVASAVIPTRFAELRVANATSGTIKIFDDGQLVRTISKGSGAVIVFERGSLVGVTGKATDAFVIVRDTSRVYTSGGGGGDDDDDDDDDHDHDHDHDHDDDDDCDD